MNQTIVRNDLVTVGATSVTLASNPPVNSRRKSIILTNTSAAGQVITIAKGEISAVVNYGTVLQPNQSLIDCNSEGYICYQGQIKGIANAAAGQISITEEFEVL